MSGFQLWSASHPASKLILTPDLGLRDWNQLTSADKYRIWQHLRYYFFDRIPRYDRDNSEANRDGKFYRFYGNNLQQQLVVKSRIYKTIDRLNANYKAKSYGEEFLEEATLTNACSDFHRIFSNEDGNVVLELLSIYADEIIIQNQGSFGELPVKTDKSYLKRQRDWELTLFRVFMAELNDVLEQFSIHVILTENGFITRQESKIITDVYIPVLAALADSQYAEVNSIMAECFTEFRKNSPESFSTCITKAVSAIQAFLQIKVHGKTGKGDISKLIPEAQAKGLIPKDLFTTEVLGRISAFLAKERQETGDAHPRKEFANQKNALLVLNVTMIFIQHCL